MTQGSGTPSKQDVLFDLQNKADEFMLNLTRDWRDENNPPTMGEDRGISFTIDCKTKCPYVSVVLL